MNKINQDLVLECGLFGLVIHFGFREKKKKHKAKSVFGFKNPILISPETYSLFSLEFITKTAKGNARRTFRDL